GRSTAGAILSLALNTRAPILDGNVKRVLARHFAVPGWPGKAAVQHALWELAEAHTPAQQFADYTQAIMDLGASVCTRTRPRCEVCPLQATCAAHCQGAELDYPGRKPKKIKPVRECKMLLCLHDQHLLLQQRPPTGIWGGLWGLPQIDSDEDPHNFATQSLGLRVSAIEALPVHVHTFSHFQLNIAPYRLTAAARDAQVLDDDRLLWYNLHKPTAVGLAAPVSKLIRQHCSEAND
ncbi:MAG: NUDIX domain-containing protein, partial [Gammaproteobacteria bacterium]|nr:NUDIX domain-containing protein [Gammaproteobacteria bacterium]